MTGTYYDKVKNSERAQKIIEDLSLINDEKIIKTIFDGVRERTVAKLAALKKEQDKKIEYTGNPDIRIALESAKDLSIETLMISNTNWLFLWDVLEATFLNNVKTQTELKSLVNALNKQDPDRGKAIEQLGERLREQEDKVQNITKYQRDVEWLHKFFDHEKTESG